MENKSFKEIVKIAVVIAILALCIINIEWLIGVIIKILKLLAPFIYGCLIAFVINVLLRKVEEWWDLLVVGKMLNNQTGKIAPRIKRPLCIVFCILIVLGILAAIVLLVAPGFSRSLVGFVDNIPQYASNINGWWTGVVAFASKYGVSLPENVLNVSDLLNTFADYLNISAGDFVQSTISKTSGVISGFVTAFLAIIFAIYILAAKERLALSTKNIIYAILPEQKADNFMKVARITNETFANFISGQCLEACVFGLMSFVGLMIFRFPFAGMIAVVLGFTTLIPVFGAWIGAIIAFLLIALVSPIKAIWFLIFLMFLQQFDNNIVYPRIVGKSVGLPGMLVLLAVTVGGSGFGLLGMLFSVPVCAVIYELFNEFVAKRLDKKGIVKDAELRK